MFDSLTKTMRWALISLAVFGVLIATIAALTVTGVALKHAFDLVRSDSEPGPYVIIGLDISEGSPLVSDPQFADLAGGFVARVIEPLERRSDITVRAFGDYGTPPSALTIDRRLTLSRNADNVARFMDRLVSGVPTIISNGTINPHGESNIVAFLESMADAVDCSRETRIILISDGLEDSEYARVGDDGQMPLPQPAAGLYQDCALLQIVGLGHGQSSPALTNELDRQWSSWAVSAGFKTYRGTRGL